MEESNRVQSFSDLTDDEDYSMTAEVNVRVRSSSERVATAVNYDRRSCTTVFGLVFMQTEEFFSSIIRGF